MASGTAARHARDGIRVLLQRKTTAARSVAATRRITPAAARISSRTTVRPRPLASTIASCIAPRRSSAATIQVAPTSTQASSSSTTVTSTQRTMRTPRCERSTGRSTSVALTILIVPLRLRARCIRLVPRRICPRSASKPPTNFSCSRKRRRRIRERDIGTSAASRADFCEPIRRRQSGTCKSRRRKRRRKLSLRRRARNRS